MVNEEELFHLLSVAIQVLEQFVQNSRRKISQDERACFIRLQQLCSARHTQESGWTEKQGMVHSLFGLAHFLTTGRYPGNRIELTRAMSLFCGKQFPEEALTRYLLDVFLLMKREIEQAGLYI